MHPILNFIISFILMCIMGALCAFLFIWANIQEIAIIKNIEKNEKENGNDRH